MQPFVIDWGAEYVISAILTDRSNSMDLILFAINNGYRITTTLYRNGTAGKTLNLYYNTQLSEPFSGTGGLKINAGDYTGSVIFGNKIGVNFSKSEGDVTNYFTATYNINTTKITVEWGVTKPGLDNTAMTEYTSVTTSITRLAALWIASQLKVPESSIPVPAM